MAKVNHSSCTQHAQENTSVSSHTNDATLKEWGSERITITVEENE